MTIRRSSVVRGIGYLEGLAGFGRKRATAPAMLALLSLALLSASTARLDSLAAAATAAPTGSQTAAPVTSAPRLHDVRSSNINVDALAGIVAKRYRISEDATRELVGTAYREAAHIGLDPLLIIAVMAVESRFNPIAQSEGGAMGLMQVIPRYHADKFDAINHASMLDPHTNIQVGAKILKEYIGRGGTETAGLQLYNGAPGDTSNAYANRVLAEKQWLQSAVRRVRDRAHA